MAEGVTVCCHRYRDERRIPRTTFSTSWERTATTFFRELKEEFRVRGAEFLVDGGGYLTAVARTDLLGQPDYSDHDIGETLFQTYTMRAERFHETRNGSQLSAERWLTAYTTYYNLHRSHQALENQTPIEAPELEGSI